MEEKFIYDFMSASIENHNILAAICDDSFKNIGKDMGKLFKTTRKTNKKVLLLSLGVAYLGLHFGRKYSELESKYDQLVAENKKNKEEFDASLLQIREEILENDLK